MAVYPGDQYRSDIIVEKGTFYNSINKALHSFTSLEVVNNFLFCRDLSNSCTIVECIIPKGAKYYKGDFEYADDSYTSDVLVYPEEF